MQRDKENMSRVSKVSMPDFDGDNLQEYMQILYSHQKQCQKEAKYQQADMAKKKLSKLRIELDRQKKEQLVDKHQNQKKEVENAHIQEMAEFNKYWDEKMIQYQNQAQKLEDQTLQRHQAQMEEFQSQIEKSIGHRQKQSGEIINLRRIEQNLAKQQNYTQAHKVQKQILELQRNEYEKWNVMRNNKIRNLLNQLRTKQQNQANALRQRIEQGFQEQKKTRDVQQQKLIQKYVNFMKELENHHRQQLLKFQKATKMQSNMNYSKAVNMSRALQSIQRN